MGIIENSTGCRFQQQGISSHSQTAVNNWIHIIGHLASPDHKTNTSLVFPSSTAEIWSSDLPACPEAAKHHCLTADLFCHLCQIHRYLDLRSGSLCSRYHLPIIQGTDHRLLSRYCGTAVTAVLQISQAIC